MKTSTSPSRRRGFTMIELLSTVAIITVLATLLLPSIKGMWKKSLSTKCLLNLHTLHSACGTYAADWGHWPTQNREDVNNPGEYGSQPWYYSMLVQGYIVARRQTREGYDALFCESLVCPVNQVNRGERMPWTSAPYPWTSNYALNERWGDTYGITPYNVTQGNIDRVPTLGIKNSNAILLVDNNVGWMYPGPQSDWNQQACTIPKKLHGKGAHALLANGAVINIDPQSHPDLSDLKYWDPRYTAP